MSISTLVEFNSFNISFLIKAQIILDGPEKILLTLILHRRHRKKAIIDSTRSKTQFWVRHVLSKREEL